MRHRLFHAIVLMGATVPVGCHSEAEAPAADADTPADTTSPADSTGEVQADSGAGFDVGDPDSATKSDTAIDACEGGCGMSCIPCIK